MQYRMISIKAWAWVGIGDRIGIGPGSNYNEGPKLGIGPGSMFRARDRIGIEILGIDPALAPTPKLLKFYLELNTFLLISIWRTFSNNKSVDKWQLNCIFLFTFLVLFSKRRISWLLFYLSKMPINANVSMIFFFMFIPQNNWKFKKRTQFLHAKSETNFFGKKWFDYLAICAPCTSYLATISTG